MSEFVDGWIVRDVVIVEQIEHVIARLHPPQKGVVINIKPSPNYSTRIPVIKRGSSK